MIPLRDTLEVEGPVWITLALVVINVVLFITVDVPGPNVWQFLLAALGLWLFGAYIERRLGSIPYLLIYLALAIVTGLLVVAIDDRSGALGFTIFLPVLGLGALHLALAPRSKILCFVPVPFAMAFYETPTIAILVGWVALEVLLFAV